MLRSLLSILLYKILTRGYSFQPPPLFDSPFAFAMVDQRRHTGKKNRCNLSGAPIRKGDQVYAAQFTSYHDDAPFLFLKQAADASPFFRQSLEWFTSRMFPPDLLFTNHPHVPETVSVSAVGVYIPDGRWMDVEQGLAKVDQIQPMRDMACAVEMIGGWVMSDLHPRMLRAWPSLSRELQVFLALSDNELFCREAESGGLLPGWSAVYALLGKEHLTLDDELALSRWGREHPDALRALDAADRRFAIFNFRMSPPIGFSRTRYADRCARLLSLFTAMPECCPLLRNFDPESPYDVFDTAVSVHHLEWLRGSEPYMLPYLYHAAVLQHIVANNPRGAWHAHDCMREHVAYYFYGEPGPYLEDTARLIEEYGDRYAPHPDA